MNQSMNPAATILIPTIGATQLPTIVGRYLEGRENIEILVIVDKPGLTREALGLPDDARLRVEVNETNMGLTCSLNRAISLSRGPIIIRNDDDDLPEPGRVAAVLEVFAKDPEAALVFSHARGQDLGSGRIWTIGGPTEDGAVKQELRRRNFIVHSTLAFRKDRLAPLGFYDETFRYAQDYDLYLRSMRAGLKFAGIPVPLVKRIYHDGSITVGRRRQQMLFSFAARIIHVAHSGDLRDALRTILSYGTLLVVPDRLRRLRRALGMGR
jgi:glycosyltransferase involved in cell wall biosynthesis